jgi:hypothetical protein
MMPDRPAKPFAPNISTTNGVHMVEVDSGDVSAMASVEFAELLTEINKKSKQFRLAILLPIVTFVAFLLMGAIGPGVVVAAIAWGLGSWIDSFKRMTVMMYELDDHLSASYQSMASAFDNLRSNDGKWHIEAGGVVRDTTTWKRNAGASHIVKKSPTELVYKLPKIVRSNLTPPSIRVGKQILYLLPDVLLVEDGSKFGAINYSQLHARCNPSNFIEEGRVPRDTQIVGHTWKHPNKSGGPDRRFKDNRQIPVCRYEALHLSSESGLNELLEFSREGAASAFSSSLKQLSMPSVGTTEKRLG